MAQLAHLRHWRIAHFRPARTSTGWRTPCQFDAQGWPDLVLVRERILYRELKSQDGATTPDQALWISALRHAGADVRVWRPSMWEEIEKTLE